MRYASWKSGACAFCGAALQAEGAGWTRGDIQPAPPVVAVDPHSTEWSYHFLFVVWFFGGLIAGLLCFPPLSVDAGAPLRARLERYLAAARPVPAFHAPAYNILPENRSGRPRGNP